MKALLFILACVWCSSAHADEVLLGDTKSTHEQERYVWSVSRERIEKAPDWKKGSRLPLSPAKAEELAYAWSRRQRLSGLIPKRPYTICLVALPAPFEDRYFYKVAFAPTDGDSFWTVHILMDGFVVEPKSIGPNQSLEPTSVLGTSAAEQPLVPSTLVAHL